MMWRLLGVAAWCSIVAACGDGDGASAPTVAPTNVRTDIAWKETPPASSPAAPAPSAPPSEMATIEGSLSYPASGIPPELYVCAEAVQSQAQYCTSEHITDARFTYFQGYRIIVPPGSYYVFAARSSGSIRAYWSEFVRCGLQLACPSHTPLVVEAASGQTVTGIDPGDFYAPETPTP